MSVENMGNGYVKVGVKQEERKYRRHTWQKVLN